MVNGDSRNSNNGPGSVPTLPQHGGGGGGAGGQQPGRGPNFPPNPGQQSEADLADIFSPVSESSNNLTQNQGIFDDGGPPRISMSPYSATGGGGGGGGGMMGGPPGPLSQQQQQQHGLRPTHPQGHPSGAGIYSMPSQQQLQPPYMRPQHHMGGMPPGQMGGGGHMHPSHHHMMMGGGHPGGPGMGGGGGRIYPPNQPMVFNPSNPNAPPIYPCGVCHKEIHDSDQAILCESGCNFWFHRTCTGLSDLAYVMLTKEIYAEWVCDRCLSSGTIPLVKMKS